MISTAVRLYGKDDLRLEEFELPALQEDEVLAKVVTNAICMSDYKTLLQGATHRRVPKNIATQPIILGHEFCGEIVKVGAKWRSAFQPGQRFTAQPAINYQGSLRALGYSYQYAGGNATAIIIPNEVLESGCLLPFEGDAFFKGSLAEPYSCIMHTFQAMYHTSESSTVHHMGIKADGNLALLGGAGPLGLAAIDCALHGERKPALLVVTDIDSQRLAWAKKVYSVSEAAKQGVSLHFLNPQEYADTNLLLRQLSEDHGFDDILVMAATKELVEQADDVLAYDGCLNFFAGPPETNFSAQLNFYDVHYNAKHVVGTSGSTIQDLKDTLALIQNGTLNPAPLISHVGGLNAVIEATRTLPNVPGGKKLIYTQIDLPLFALADLPLLGRKNPFYAALAEIVDEYQGVWSAEAEKFLLQQQVS